MKERINRVAMSDIKDISAKQEKRIARLVDGKVQSNSGGTKFGGGDIHTESMFIEAKTVAKPQKSITVQKDWIEKAQEQAFEQGKYGTAVAIAFDPEGPDYFIINAVLFKTLVNCLERE